MVDRNHPRKRERRVDRKKGGMMSRALGGLVFAVGLILGLLGYMTDVYTSATATLLMLGVWFMGAAVIGAYKNRGRGTDRPPDQAGSVT
jgi:hypothetical protein